MTAITFRRGAPISAATCSAPADDGMGRLLRCEGAGRGPQCSRTQDGVPFLVLLHANQLPFGSLLGRVITIARRPTLPIPIEEFWTNRRLRTI
jgi:hypothetical protein